MAPAAQLRDIRRRAIMAHSPGMTLSEPGLMQHEANAAARDLGWSYSHTAGLNQFYTSVRPVWWILRAETGEELYLTPAEAARFLAQTAGLGRQTVETASDRDITAYCWSNGDIHMKVGVRWAGVTRMSNAEVRTA